MCFLDAGTLKERFQANPLSLTEVDRYFTQLAEALAYAHSKGIIHRDIKPSNALVDETGDIFLMDFGIAKIVESTIQLTATGAITGTPAYMSPEQGQGLKVDHRTDIYSLGVVLYEMITGRVPFEAETPMAVIFKKVQEPLPPPSVYKADINPEIEAVVLKSLAKNPADRFPTTQEFLTAWKRALNELSRSEPVPHLPLEAITGIDQDMQAVPTASSIPWKWLLPVVGLGGLLLIVITVIGANYLMPKIGGGACSHRPGAGPAVCNGYHSSGGYYQGKPYHDSSYSTDTSADLTTNQGTDLATHINQRHQSSRFNPMEYHPLVFHSPTPRPGFQPGWQEPGCRALCPVCILMGDAGRRREKPDRQFNGSLDL